MLVDYINSSEYTVDDIMGAHSHLKARSISHPNIDQIKMVLANFDEMKSTEIAEYNSIEFKVIEDESANTLASLANMMNNKTLVYDGRTN